MLTQIVLANAINDKNELVREAVFAKVDKQVYSDKNPIPINNKLPVGIIFKVQIGAFKNSIPQDLFKFGDVENTAAPCSCSKYFACSTGILAPL